MVRLPIGAICLSSMVVLTTAFGAGCSGDDDDSPDPSELPTEGTIVTPPPTSGTSSFLDNDGHPHTWALVRQVDQHVYVYSSPITSAAWYEQVTNSYFLVTWKDKGTNDSGVTQIEQTEQLCEADASDIVLKTKIGNQNQSMAVNDALYSKIPEDIWQAGLGIGTDDAGNSVYTYDLTGTLYSVWGAKLSDPINDRCPMRDDAGTSYDEGNPPPENWDEDEDTYPGVTTNIQVEGKDFSDSYVCQRLNFTQTQASVTTVDGKYHMQGYIRNFVNDQSQYWSSNGLLDDQDPEVSWDVNKDGPATYYIMVELPDGAGCSDVKSSFVK